MPALTAGVRVILSLLVEEAVGRKGGGYVVMVDTNEDEEDSEEDDVADDAADADDEDTEVNA